MSELQVLLGADQGGALHAGHVTYKLFPLNLADLAEAESRFGSIVSWASPETQEKLKTLGATIFLIWLSIRKNPTASPLTESDVGKLFDLRDLTKLTDALLHVLEISGLSIKNASRAAPEAGAAPSPGSGSSPISSPSESS